MILASVLAALILSSPNADKVDPRQRSYVMPSRIVASSRDCGRLLEPKFGQVSEGRFLDSGAPVLTATNDFVLVDFGRELHGGVAIGCGAATAGDCRVRLVFGESVGEAMSRLGEKGAQQCHAIRDVTLTAPWCGVLEFGNTGFRFLKIELPEGGALQLDSVRAVSLMRPMTAQGGFRCSDERLNAIWNTAVRTVHLCAQDYIWDGIKRDRLVWQGDMHPEVTSLLAVFGADPVIADSLDYMARTTEPDKWMNGMPSYSMWWILCLHDLWFHTGDLSFARANAGYFAKTVAHLAGCVGEDGSWSFDGSWSRDGFLDWPTQHNQPAVKAGMCGLFIRAMESARALAVALGDDATAALCVRTAANLRKVVPEPHGAKSAAALLALSGLREPRTMFDEILGRNGTDGVSTFYGYYMLEAMSAADETPYAIGVARDYWGAMLDMGATSFWEDFNVCWTNDATRLDEMPVVGKKDIHGDFGDFCYVGFRHSLCHGWSSGPAAWLIHRVLGVRILEPGAAKVEVRPCLSGLEWAEGALATPKGPVRVRAERVSGRLQVDVSAPDGVQVVRGDRCE